MKRFANIFILGLLGVVVKSTQEVKQFEMRENEKFDVYFINLSRRQDREEHMRAELSRHGITPANGFNVIRFEAIDGKVKNWTSLVGRDAKLFARFDAAGLGDKPNSNILKSNSLSHVGVWRRLIASGAPHAVVLQDDAQLTEGFREGLADVLRHNPPEAFITWIGLNGYASGAVSRSAAMKLGHYDPDNFSRELPGTNGVLGRCRPGLIATGSLAYLLTRRGALALVARFGTLPPLPPLTSLEPGLNGSPEDDAGASVPTTPLAVAGAAEYGWEHHTDHAMVGFLDGLSLSFVSRKVLATTHDDGVFGSDIFEPAPAEAEALRRAEVLVRAALKHARLPLGQAVAAATLDSLDAPVAAGVGVEREETQRPSEEELPSWLRGVRVKCEESSCYDPSCPAPRQTTAFLSWVSGDDGEEEDDDEEEKNDNDEEEKDDDEEVNKEVGLTADQILMGSFVSEEEDEPEDGTYVDHKGVRRLLGRKAVVLPEAAERVTALMAAAALPAWWTLEAWSVVGRHHHRHQKRERSGLARGRRRLEGEEEIDGSAEEEKKKDGKRSTARGEAAAAAAAAAAKDAARVPFHPRPRFEAGARVECAFGGHGWEPATVLAVGYRDAAWTPDTVTTYVVQHADGRLLTVPVDKPDAIRASAALAQAMSSSTGQRSSVPELRSNGDDGVEVFL